MKIVKTLDKDFCLNVISKYEDVLKKDQEKLASYFKDLQCVKCGKKNIIMIPCFKKQETEDGIKEVPVFEESSLLPKQMAKCMECNCEFEPYTKLIVKLA